MGHAGCVLGGLAARNDCVYIAHAAGSPCISLVDCESLTLRRRISVESPGGLRTACAGLAIGPTFLIYVADPGARIIHIINVFGRSIGRAGEAAPANAGFASDRRGALAEPCAAAVDRRGNLYVASAGGPRVHAVQKYGVSGRYLGSFRAFGVAGETFSSPRSLVTNGDYLYVADTGDAAVQVFTTAGSFSHVFSTAASHGERSAPISLCLEPGGTLLILDRGDATALRRFESGGEYLETVIDHEYIQSPVAVARAASGLLFILDRDGERLRAFTAAGALAADLTDLLDPAAAVGRLAAAPARAAGDLEL